MTTAQKAEPIPGRLEYPGREDRETMKYSRVYKTESGGRFRYNYDTGMLQKVLKATGEILQENEEWRQKFGGDLWEIVDGECIIDEIGILPEDWQESPQYWAEQYDADINAECAAWAALEFGR